MKLSAECKSHARKIHPPLPRHPCPSINCCLPSRFFLSSFLHPHRNARKHLPFSSDILLAIAINMSSPRSSRSFSSPQAEASPSAQQTLVFPCHECGKRFQVSIDRTFRTAKSGKRVELRCPGCEHVVGWSTEDAIQDNISEVLNMVGRAAAPQTAHTN